MKASRKVAIRATFEAEDVARIDRWRRSHKLTRAEAVRRLALIGVRYSIAAAAFSTRRP